MFGRVDEFLGWFDGVHRRTVRDVTMLPPEAAAWRPAVPDPESGVAWGVPDLVAHIAEARGYFASAFLGRGWVWETWPERPADVESWRRVLDESLQRLRDALRDAGPDAVSRRIGMIGDPERMMSAWRTMMMMAEHEVAHRSQIVTYAALNGWPTSQIFGATSEWVRSQRDEQMRRHRS